MAEEIIMTGKELARACVDIANTRKTIYGYAMYGFQITDKTIASKAKQNLNGWYTAKRIRKLQAVANQNPPVWGFDCVNLIKAILWGWNGDETKEKGGAVYAANGIPDTNADGLFGRCRDKSADFTDIQEGEAVHIAGHIGVYVGGGLVVECTPNWEDGVQITALGNVKNEFSRGLYRVRSWDKHGKLPHVGYALSVADGASSPTGGAEEDGEELPDEALGRRILKKGCAGEDVKALQLALISLGYELGDFGPNHDGADGEFGRATQKAVEAFQAAAGIEVDGKFGPASLEALKAALEAKSASQGDAKPEPLFTVVIRHLSATDAAGLAEMYPDAGIEAE